MSINSTKSNVKNKITFDNINYMCMTEFATLKYLQKSNKFVSFITTKLGIDNNMTSDIWEAFILARNKLYPQPLESWEKISARQAEKNLDNRISLYNILKLAKPEAGVLRTSDGKVYKEEIELLRTVLDLKDIFIKSGAILDTTDNITGKEIYAILPKSMDKLKTGELDQTLKVMKILVSHPFSREFIAELQS
jgi:hypothetical protein